MVSRLFGRSWTCWTCDQRSTNSATWTTIEILWRRMRIHLPPESPMATELFLRLISLNKDGAMYLGAFRSIHLSCQPGPCCRLQLKWWQASKSRRSVSSEGSSELAHGLDSSVQSNQSHCRRSARLNFSRSKMLSSPKLRGACSVSKLLFGPFGEEKNHERVSWN